MSEALNDVFISNFEKDPTLTWQYFGSSTGFFRLYPGNHQNAPLQVTEHSVLLIQTQDRELGV